MTKISSILVVVVISLFSCKKAEEYRFDHSPNVYFDIYNQDKDSIVYTFAYDPTRGRDTIYLPVRISGVRADFTRYFSAHVEADSSTALPGKHYEPLKDQYPVVAGNGGNYLPFVIYNTDTLLRDKAVSVIIKLNASDDFGVEVPDLIRAKVVFSAKLEKPNWWDTWPLGTYSRVKHELFIQVTGKTSLSTNGLDAPMNLYLVGLLTSMLNNPFDWAVKNATKGYLTEKIDENSYYFYNAGNPGRKYFLRKNQQNGKFYFIDENGKEVN